MRRICGSSPLLKVFDHRDAPGRLMLTNVSNRLLVSSLICLSLMACAHVEGVKTLRSYSGPTKKAIVIGRVKISPRIDDNGKVHPEGGNTPAYFNVFTKDPTLRRKTGEGL